MPNTVDSNDETVAAAFEAQLTEHGPAILQQMNEAYEDSLLLVGRVLGGVPSATAARAMDVDASGLSLGLATPDGEHRVRVEFAEPVVDVTQIGTSTMALVVRARAQSGETGETSAERQIRLMSTVRTFLTSVVAVRDVHPHLRQITFGGGDLTTFVPLGPDTFLYVLLPPVGRTELTIDAGFTWEAWAEMPEPERPVGAYYTLRAWRPDACELDMLFVLHEPAGPASAWAARAQPGDPVALWGPREAFEPPADASRFLLVADETGLPALAAILDWLPATASAVVVAECDRADEHQPLPVRPNVEVHWLHRDGRPAGTVPELVLDAVAALDLDPEGSYAWGGGESRAMTGVRKLLRRSRGWPRERVSLVAYWRHPDSPMADPEE